jgi:hypothetical protein
MSYLCCVGKVVYFYIEELYKGKSEVSKMCTLSFHCSCGIGLDSWILPIDLSILDGSGIKQPLLFINSFDWQWKRNIQRMMKLTSSSPQAALITIR